MPNKALRWTQTGKQKTKTSNNNKYPVYQLRKEKLNSSISAVITFSARGVVRTHSEGPVTVVMRKLFT